MIYKEYTKITEDILNLEFNDSLLSYMREGWELITHFNYEVKDRYSIVQKITFILGRNEIPKTLYGKD